MQSIYKTMHPQPQACESAKYEVEEKMLIDLPLYWAAKWQTLDGFMTALKGVGQEKPRSAIFDMVNPIENTCFHIAAQSGNGKVVEWIARNYPTLLWKKNSNGDTALHLAAREGHLDTVQELLKAQKDYEGDQSCVESSRIEEEPSLMIRNEKGNTALHEALVNSREEIAYRLIEEDPEGGFVMNNKHDTPLSLSAKAGYKKCVGLILSRKGELEKFIHQVNTGNGTKSPAHEAITSRSRDVLKMMISEEPRFLHFMDEEGRFPLHYASSMDYKEGVNVILERSSVAAIERDKNGLLAIHWAATMGKKDVMKVLLLYWPYPKELVDTKGRTILHYMAKFGQSQALGHFLDDQRYEDLINLKDKEGNTPLHLAAMNFHSYTVNMLIWEPRVDRELVNDMDMTALDAAEKLLGDAPTWEQRLTLGALRTARVPRVRPGDAINFLSETISIPMEESKSKYYRDRVNNLLIVSTLIATITFAAGFTMPGGYNNSDPNQGMATMLERKKFQVFILCDTISMYCSIIVAVALIWAQFGNELEMGRAALRFSLPLLGISLSMLSLAFMAGISVVVDELKWLNITVLVMGVTFTCITSAIFFPLWFRKTSSRHLRCMYFNPIILPQKNEAEPKGCFANLC